MKPVKVMVIFGTRPEAIKLAPLILALKKRPSFHVQTCLTGQHRTMVHQVLKVFEINPDFDLDIMIPGQSLNDITVSSLARLQPVIAQEEPDIVLVQGDTTTVFAASLAAFYQKVKVGHVEAGLRTGNKYSPWPEEINRQLTTRISDYHFAPTGLSRENLIKENVPESRILVTGNTVIDALLSVVSSFKDNSKIESGLIGLLEKAGYLVSSRKIVLITGHRRENFGAGFQNICLAIAELADKNPAVDFVYPVHLNPNVQEPVNKLLSGRQNIFLIRPLDYKPFIYLMYKSYLILTDSGGIQEEAPSLGKPVLVMRDTTERPEAVAVGTVKLVGSEKEMIVNSVTDLLEKPQEYQLMSKAHNPYGDGSASERIADFLLKVFQGGVSE